MCLQRPFNRSWRVLDSSDLRYKRLYDEGREQGANPSEWRGTFDAVSSGDWVSVQERTVQGKWVDFDMNGLLGLNVRDKEQARRFIKDLEEAMLEYHRKHDAYPTLK